MTKEKITKALWLGAAVGLVFFLITSVAPMFAGEEPGAAGYAVDRDAAAEAAERYVRERLGDETLELRAFAMYAADREALGYLYREGTYPDVQERFRETLPLEAYRVEVKEADGAVHFVDINPYTGRPTEWDLSRSGEPVAADKLEAIGRETLAELGWTGAAPKLLSVDEAYGEVAFELSDPAFREAAAEIRVRADDLGATSFVVNWIAPEAYTAHVEDQDRWSSALGAIGMTLSGLLQFAAFVYALARLKDVRWSRGVWMAIVFGAFYCVLNVNMYPGLKATLLDMMNGGEYASMSADDPAAAIAGMIAALLLTNAYTLALAIGMYFSAVAGDTLAARQGYRVWPLPEEPGYASRLASAAAKGYLFAPVLLGVQSVLFLAAERSLGSWYTVDALTSPMNMVVPALMPLLAWCAAVEEEAVYRLFAIPALTAAFGVPGAWLAAKLGFRVTPASRVFLYAAVAVSSMIWALGHVQYPIYPFYTRFAEVSALGLLFAYIFLRHGFLTAVFAHAVVDLIWTGIAVVSGEPTAANAAIFAVYLATPALVALAVRLRRSRTLPPAPTPG
ncbi:CPBP family intramembrane glutamic endopeptidase [Paenibacillus sp.]|uniref:CPBP family intramembrane glutamic endopeptidase n=1 Tax=Paenibacillus sp. TaxID=58172 RepID=UPI002D49AA30|nr:CPBP family intramembrane glutamic endopeptidase [Paenibacillus sp.]HZG57552.1 CPBP family intramembrane glutamic endopeptidase [Paenibacillus sp.]